MLIARNEPSPKTFTPDAQPQTVTAEEPAVRPKAARAATTKSREANRAPAAKSMATTAVKAEPDPAGANMSESETKQSVAPVSASTRVEATAAAATQEPAAITITGCLERDDEKFRLKNTEGANAPRSRSWKSGFIRRSNSSVDVLDASNRFNLANHVGERVSATGTLVDGDMQLRSLRRVATSCDEEA
jgi:hypothetical protein